MILLNEVQVKYNSLGVPDKVYQGIIRQTDNYVTRLKIDLTDVPGDISIAGLNVKKEDGTTNTDGLIICHPIVGQAKNFYVDISNWYTNIPGTLELTIQALASMNGLTQVFNCSKITFCIEGTATELDPTVVPEFFNVLSVNGYTGVVDITHENIGDEPDAEVAVPDEENNTNFKFRTFKAGPHIVITQYEDHIKISLADDIPTNDEVDGALSALSEVLTEALNTHAGNDNAHNLASLRSTVSGLVTAVGNLQTVVGSGGADADVIINKLAEVYTFLANFEENDDLLAMINSKLEEVVVEGGEEEEGKYVSAVKRDEYDPNKVVVEKKTLPSVPTKVSELENDSGFVTEEDLPPEEVDLFWCTYGTTTYADITTAINNGKLPVVKYLDRIYRLTCAEGNFQIGLTHHHFEAVIGEISHYVRVSNLNTWHANAYTLAKSSDIPTKVSELENDSSFITEEDLPEITGGGVVNLGAQPTKNTGLSLCVNPGLYTFTVAGISYLIEVNLNNETPEQKWIEIFSSSTIAYSRAWYGEEYGWHSFPPQILSLSDAVYWESQVWYKADSIVRGSNNKVYYSKAHDNNGNNPVDDINFTYWGEVDYENVQSDWNVTDTTSEAYVKNKPSIPVISNNIIADAGSTEKGISVKATKDYVDLKAIGVYRFKGSVASYEYLPTENMVLGDVWNVTDTGINYAWDGLDWDNLGMSVDLSDYYNKTEINTIVGDIETLLGGI